MISIKRVSHQRRFFLLLICISVLTLSGCGIAEYDGGFKNISNLGNAIQNIIYSCSVDAHQLFDGFVYSFEMWLLDTFNFGSISQTLRDVSEYFSETADLVGWFQVLSLGYIAVNFAWTIVRDFIIVQDNSMNEPIFHRIKKLLIAIMMTFFIPLLTFSCFAGSAMLGMTFSRAIATSTPTHNQGEADMVLDYMDDLKISYSSYCKVEINEKTVKVPSSSSSEINVMYDPDNRTEPVKRGGFGRTVIKYISNIFTGGDDYDLELIEETEDGFDQGVQPVLSKQAKVLGLTDSEALERYKVVWNNTCGQGGVYRVYEGLLKNKDTRKYLSTSNNFLGNFFTTITSFIFFLVASWSLIKRTFDIVFLTLMSWYYCGESIKGGKAPAFSSMGKKLLKICMTTFFTLVEIATFISFNHTSEVSLLQAPIFSVTMQIAWIMFILKTPAVMEELIHDSGAGQDFGYASSAFNKWNKKRKEAGQ